MISIFTLALAANEAREVALVGEYFELRNALYPIPLIELLDRTGSVISRLENPEQSDFVRPGRYETVRITNGPTAQIVKHFYGSGDAGSRRTSGQVQVLGTVGVMGSVSVIDTNQDATIAGRTFLGTYGYTAPAGQLPHIQLKNPAGSGKIMVVSSMSFSSNISAGLGVGFYATNLISPNAVPLSKKASGGVASVGEIRIQNAAAGLIPAAAVFLSANLSAGGYLEKVFPKPIVLNPGDGVCAYLSTAAAALSLNFESEEY